jgi:hypothetical protein
MSINEILHHLEESRVVPIRQIAQEKMQHPEHERTLVIDQSLVSADLA